jgi:heme/copper-type cytochrome/quinol oxidase subunit 3
MSNPWFLVPFLVGTAAFFVTLYITMFVPKMSDTPWNVEDDGELHPLRRWDTIITWLMWGGWGVAMVMHFLNKNKYLDQIERLLG